MTVMSTSCPIFTVMLGSLINYQEIARVDALAYERARFSFVVPRPVRIIRKHQHHRQHLSTAL